MHHRFPFIRTTILVCLFAFLGNTASDDRGGTPPRLLLDTDSNYTTIGNIGLTVTNFGTIGTRNTFWREGRPSCEYPIGSRIEHIFQGGLWVGAEIHSASPARDGIRAVSTGSSNTVSTTTGKGFEYTSLFGTTLIQKSSLSDSPFFDTSAVSHQDFIGWYSDEVPRDSTEPDRSVPLNITVRQESYAWNFPFADAFVLVNYTIYNTGVDTLDSLYVGLWDNAVVRNTNNVQPGTAGYFERSANGYSDSLRMKYTFDYSGIPTPPAAGSYVGVKLLGAIPFPIGVDSLADLTRKTYYNAWTFTTTASGDVAYWSPRFDFGTLQGERSRYDRMTAPLAQDKIAALRTLQPQNVTTLVSSGPYRSLRPGDSLQIVYAVVCARKFGSDPANLDTRAQRLTLYTNARFAQQAYDGEDVRGDNIYRPELDLNGNGKLDHFILPQPPRPPKVRAALENQNVALYWDRSTSELSFNPITRKLDFEGYRIYRSNPGADFDDPENLLFNLSLVGEFDKPDDNIGYNTGFGRILLSQPKKFPGDTVDYWYKFPPQGETVSHLNGWQYLYGVAAFSTGDSATGLVSLQSKTEIRRLIPGTDTTQIQGKSVGVYPNPYYANAAWDGKTERTRKIYFYNLPARCTIRIYTLAGDVVADLDHEAATYDGSEIEWFQRFGGGGAARIQFSGGEHAWNLITKFDQAIATGLYLFSVKNSDTGEIKTGKFLVIK